MPAERWSVIFIFESRCFLETTQHDIAIHKHFQLSITTVDCKLLTVDFFLMSVKRFYGHIDTKGKEITRRTETDFPVVYLPELSAGLPACSQIEWRTLDIPVQLKSGLENTFL